MRLAAVSVLLPVVLAIAAPISAPVSAQQAGDKVYRLAELAPTKTSLDITRAETLPKLARLGYREGRNVILDERVATPQTAAYRPAKA
jgi:hypothetical protein